MSTREPGTIGRIDELDPAELGKVVMRAVATSALFSHERIADTVGTYYRGSQPEVEFFRDVLTKPTGQVASKWFGSELDAAAAGAYRIAEMLA